MVFEAEQDIAARHPCTDPWAATTLSPDNTQHTWLISYLDILLLLLTLFVVLLGWQKRAIESSATAARTTQVADVLQTATEPQPPPLRHIPSAPLDNSPPPQEAQSVTRLSPENHPQPAAATTAPLPPHARHSILLSGASGQNIVAPAIDGSAAEPAAVAEQQAAVVHHTVPWEPPEELQEQVEMSRETKQIRLEIKDTFLFASGSADLKPQAASLLQNLVGMLQRQPGRISVEGHTDDQPIATARYPSNWELSAARASTVARYLIRHGVAAHRVQAVGYADTQPRSPNDRPEGQARNRRVTLVIYPEEEAPTG